tara:strand:+ start:4070 stop:4261 length:192 start_codon:yes stop_codon:yes gene_type:complete
MAVDKDILKLKKEIKELKKDLQSIKKEFQIVSVSNQEMKAFFENIYEITTIINEENDNDRMAN